MKSCNLNLQGSKLDT